MKDGNMPLEHVIMDAEVNQSKHNSKPTRESVPPFLLEAPSHITCAKSRREYYVTFLHYHFFCPAPP
jgi:hypothetical protein